MGSDRWADRGPYPPLITHARTTSRCGRGSWWFDAVGAVRGEGVEDLDLAGGEGVAARRADGERSQNLPRPRRGSDAHA